MCGLDKNKLFTQNTIKTTKERVIAVVGGLFQGNMTTDLRVRSTNNDIGIKIE